MEINARPMANPYAAAMPTAPKSPPRTATAAPGGPPGGALIASAPATPVVRPNATVTTAHNPIGVRSPMRRPAASAAAAAAASPFPSAAAAGSGLFGSPAAAAAVAGDRHGAKRSHDAAAATPPPKPSAQVNPASLVPPRAGAAGAAALATGMFRDTSPRIGAASAAGAAGAAAGVPPPLGLNRAESDGMDDGEPVQRKFFRREGDGPAFGSPAPAAASAFEKPPSTPAGNDDADSFLSLIKTFAQMGMPQANDVGSGAGGVFGAALPDEKCPLCPEVVKALDFPAHVMKCVQKLDDEELARETANDEIIAQQYANMQDCRFGGACTDHSTAHRSRFAHPEMHRRYMPKTQKPKCPKGKLCAERESRHFTNFEHPDVPCPVCESLYPIYEMEAHVSMCLTRPRKSTPSPVSGIGFPFAGFGGTPVKSPTGPAGAAGAAAGAMSMDDSSLPAPAAASAASASAFGGAAAAAAGGSASANASPHKTDDPAVPGMQRSTSTLRGQFTRQQMSTIAQFVVNEQSKKEAERSTDLFSLLDSFKQLGFTKENLLKEMQSSSPQPAGANVFTSFTTSPPPAAGAGPTGVAASGAFSAASLAASFGAAPALGTAAAGAAAGAGGGAAAVPAAAARAATAGALGGGALAGLGLGLGAAAPAPATAAAAPLHVSLTTPVGTTHVLAPAPVKPVQVGGLLPPGSPARK